MYDLTKELTVTDGRTDPNYRKASKSLQTFNVNIKLKNFRRDIRTNALTLDV